LLSRLNARQNSRIAGVRVAPDIMFLKLPEPKIVKNRLHLDLRCKSFEAERSRLLALGAAVVAEHVTFVVLSDPEGNEFCLSRRGQRPPV